MTTWSDYRMWYRAKRAVSNSGWSSEWLEEWKPTDHIFRARSQAEAQKKADKFWRMAELGSGSMVCIPANESIPSAHVASR